jgi:Spy/CpxP family protein refolding chaperone
MALKRARLRSDIRAVLTPEQQKQLDAQRAEAREKMRERRKQRHARHHDGDSDSDHLSAGAADDDL